MRKSSLTCPGPGCDFKIKPGTLTARGLTTDRLAFSMANFSDLGWLIVDRTGLAGAREPGDGVDWYQGKEPTLMRFHAPGLIVLGVFLVLALIAGAWSVVAVARLVVIVFAIAALIEVVVNMVRHRDLRVRSRLLRLLGGQGSFASWPNSRQP
jgi:hypothetical protein